MLQTCTFQREAEAITSFERVMTLASHGPLRIAAAVNIATCTVQQGQLAKAIEVWCETHAGDRNGPLLSMSPYQVAEQLIREDPLNNMDVALCSNLCMMYDLQNEQTSAAKRALIVQLVKQYAADDFDVAVISP